MKRFLFSGLVVCLVYGGAFGDPAFRGSRGPIGSRLSAAVGAPNPQIDYVAMINDIARGGRDESLNAGPYYQGAVAASAAGPAALTKLVTDRWAGSLSAGDILQVRQWVEANSHALMQLEAGSRKPFYWVVRISNDRSVRGMQVDGLAELRRLGIAITARAKLNAADGNVERALGDVGTCYRFGLHVSSSPILIEQMTGLALRSLALDCGFEILWSGDASSTTLALFQKDIETVSAGARFTPDMRSEKFMVLDIIQRIFTDDGAGNGRIHAASAQAMGLGQSAGMGNLGLRETRDAVERVYGYFETLGSRSAWQLKNEVGDPAAQIEQITGGNVLVATLTPAFFRTAEVFRRSMAQVDALITTLGVLRYLQEKGQAPSRLEDVVSGGYLSWVPKDPFSGSGFVYRQSGRDFVLYSFGEDCDDDGGVRSNWGSVRNGGGGGDQVFWPIEGGEALVTQAPGAGVVSSGVGVGVAPVPVRPVDPAVNRRDQTGFTPLFYAAQKGDIAAVRDLLGRGAEANIKDSNGNTPLHYAAFSGHYEVCEMLVSSGADTGSENVMGKTAAALAQSKGQSRIVELLNRRPAAVDSGTGLIVGLEQVSNMMVRNDGGGYSEPGAAEPNRITDVSGVRAAIKGFPGLDEEFMKVDRRSRYEIAEWLEIRVNDKVKLAKAVLSQERAEMNLIRKVALAEKAVKTTAAVDTLLRDRSNDLRSVAKKLEEEKRNTLQVSGGLGGAYGGYGVGLGYGRSRYSRSRSRTTTAKSEEREEAEAAAEEAKAAAEAEEAARIGLDRWTAVTADTKTELAKMVYYQAWGGLWALREPAAAEGARKTAAAVDGVLLMRQDRLAKLLEKIQAKAEAKQKEASEGASSVGGRGFYSPRTTYRRGR